jgi:hypothetical protein
MKRPRTGTGSGLSIVRRITDIHRTALQPSPKTPMGLPASINSRAP